MGDCLRKHECKCQVSHKSLFQNKSCCLSPVVRQSFAQEKDQSTQCISEENLGGCKVFQLELAE